MQRDGLGKHPPPRAYCNIWLLLLSSCDPFWRILTCSALSVNNENHSTVPQGEVWCKSCAAAQAEQKRSEPFFSFYFIFFSFWGGGTSTWMPNVHETMCGERRKNATTKSHMSTLFGKRPAQLLHVLNRHKRAGAVCHTQVAGRLTSP